MDECKPLALMSDSALLFAVCLGRVLGLRGGRVTRYDPILLWEIDMGHRYGRSDISIVISIRDMGYRCGIRANHMGDESIDMVILPIDMGYLVTLPAPRARGLRGAAHDRGFPEDGGGEGEPRFGYEIRELLLGAT